MDDIFIARQPIYDQHHQLIGYELLYRAGDTTIAEFSDGKLASSQVILNSFLNIGFDGLIGSTQAFINITEDFILDEALTPMYDKQIVLEVLEDIPPSEEVVAGVKRLKKKGYKIALDDFQYSPEYDELLRLADFVKIDVIKLTTKEIISELKKLKSFNAKVVAEKVETPEMYTFCKQVEFDYFQGFHFCKPQLVNINNIPANKLVVLNLLKLLNKPDFDFNEIEKAIAQDAVLTYKLLRYVNSAAFSQRKEVDSIKDALALVGGNTIKKWANLILTMQLAEGKPQALLVTALVRAKMCELLEEASDNNNGEMFTIGLFSLLDALMDVALDELMDDLTLSSEVKFAILDHQGEKGDLLENVICYEQGQWVYLTEQGIDSEVYFSSYMEAVKWTDSTIESLHE